MICCIVVAAGKGKRFKSKIPKTLFLMQGVPIVEYCLQTLSKCPLIDEIILVMQKKFIETTIVSKWKMSFSKIGSIVPGGRFREESVLNGLSCCSRKYDTILIHDGARPFVSENLIKRVIKATIKYGACIPVYPVNGSVKSVRKNRVISTIFEEGIQVAQTPQGFKREIIEKIFSIDIRNLKKFPDEASLCIKQGFDVYAIPGEAKNIKITTKQDLHLALAILNSFID